MLRFVGAASVLLFHYTFRGGAAGGYMSVTFRDGWTRYGFLGVNLFFIISGFVMLLTVDAGNGRPAHFVASRISRLFPAFWVAATLTFMACVVTDAPFKVGVGDFLANLGMFPSLLGARYVDGAYWTLETELYFYLLVTGYLLFLRRRVELEWLLLAWLAVILVFVPVPWGPGRLRALVMADTGPYFVAGCVFYRIWRDGWTRIRVAILAGAWLAALVFAGRGALAVVENFSTPVSPVTSAGVVSIWFLIFMAMCLRPSLFRIGGRRSTFVGALTYPLYLVHQFIGYLVIAAIAPRAGRWVALAITIATLLTIAYAIHRLVEVRYNARMRRWLAPRLNALNRFADTAHAWLPQRRPNGNP